MNTAGTPTVLDEPAGDSATAPASALKRRLSAAIFESRSVTFATVLLAAAVVRSGVWYRPDIDAVRVVALDPFSSRLADPALEPVLNHWLGAALAWAIGARGHWSFIAFHLAYAAAASVLFACAAFKRLSPRSARVALLIYATLPISTQGYYWSGPDSITVFLLVAAFAVASNVPLLAFIGFVVGMQDFELGVIAGAAAALACVLSSSPTRRRLRPGALVFVGSVVVGRIALELILRLSDISHGGTLRVAFPMIVGQGLDADRLEDVATSMHVVVFAMLGVGWLVMARFVRDGVSVATSRPHDRMLLLLLLCALAPLMALTDDHTRVIGIVTFPLITTFWLVDEHFLASLGDRFLAVLLVMWIAVPWAWVVGGNPQVSATPYSAAFVVGNATGWFDPSDDPHWPFNGDDANPSVQPNTANAAAGGAQGNDTPPREAPVDAVSRETARSAGLTFDHQVIDPDPPSGDECCLDVIAPGDIDGDGAIDLVVGTEHADGLSWYRNPGASSPLQWERFSIGSGDFTTDGETADLDGDGDVDVIASSIDRNMIEWWEQIDDPTTTVGWVRHDVGPVFAHDVVVADIDGDNDLDVAAFHTAAGLLDWFEQPEDPGSAWAGHDIERIQGEGLTASDLDGDGDVDLVAGPAVYYAEPSSGATPTWRRVDLAPDWEQRARSAVGDVDNDGVLDIALSFPETEGRLSWFTGPDWTEHVIEPDAGYTHSLELGDVDLDGHLDLVTGVMHWAGSHEVRVLLGDGGRAWRPIVLSTDGTHNARLVDLDLDGRLDIAGKNFEGPKQVDVWWNREFVPAQPPPRPAADVTAATPLDGFTYVELDDERSRFDANAAFFGVAFGDLDGDGFDDIASGGYLYLNPSGNLASEWRRIDLAEQFGVTVDSMLITDLDGDGRGDVIAEALPDVWWLEDADGDGTWTGRVVATIPPTSHTNGQGYRLADLTADDEREIVLSGGPADNEIWYLAVPPHPRSDEWTSVRVTDRVTDEQMGVGDIDGDGDNDIAAGSWADGPLSIRWFENPGNGGGDWIEHTVGDFPGDFPDRLDLADLDGDRQLDVVVTEETPSEDPVAEVMWYRQPSSLASGPWQRNTIGTGYSMNAMDVADMDGDGDLDVVTGELFGDRRVIIWENQSAAATWIPHEVDRGKESHLGSRVWDLDRDGDLEIVSIGWNEPNYLHLWVND